MSGTERVTLVGSLTADPELPFTPTARRACPSATRSPDTSHVNLRRL
jgi:single-stranded DNA-binding protein